MVWPALGSRTANEQEQEPKCNLSYPTTISTNRTKYTVFILLNLFCTQNWTYAHFSVI